MAALVSGTFKKDDEIPEDQRQVTMFSQEEDDLAMDLNNLKTEKMKEPSFFDDHGDEKISEEGLSFSIENSRDLYEQNAEYKRDEFGFEEMKEEDKKKQEEIEEERLKAEEEAKWLEHFKDPNRNMEVFNPKMKYGDLQDGYWVYDKTTSSYKLNLPPDFYERYVKSV